MNEPPLVPDGLNHTGWWEAPPDTPPLTLQQFTHLRVTSSPPLVLEAAQRQTGVQEDGCITGPVL